MRERRLCLGQCLVPTVGTSWRRWRTHVLDSARRDRNHLFLWSAFSSRGYVCFAKDRRTLADSERRSVEKLCIAREAPRDSNEGYNHRSLELRRLSDRP